METLFLEEIISCFRWKMWPSFVWENKDHIPREIVLFYPLKNVNISTVDHILQQKPNVLEKKKMFSAFPWKNIDHSSRGNVLLFPWKNVDHSSRGNVLCFSLEKCRPQFYSRGNVLLFPPWKREITWSICSISILLAVACHSVQYNIPPPPPPTPYSAKRKISSEGPDR